MDHSDRERFLELIAGAHERFGVLIHAHALMGNHYHIVAQFPDQNMSQVLHWIGTCFAQYINRKYDYDGRLCKDRFFNNPIEDEEYLLAAVRYVHRNPTSLGLRSEELQLYPWSNYRNYVNPEPLPEWMRTDLVLSYFSNDRRRYSEFVQRPLEADTAESPIAATSDGGRSDRPQAETKSPFGKQRQNQEANDGDRPHSAG